MRGRQDYFEELTCANVTTTLILSTDGYTKNTLNLTSEKSINNSYNQQERVCKQYVGSVGTVKDVVMFA